MHLHTEDLNSFTLSRPASAGIAFFLLALVAMIPYLLNVGRVAAQAASVGVSLVALFALGSKLFTLKHVSLKGGVESAGIGALAAAVLYAAGLLISTF